MPFTAHEGSHSTLPERLAHSRNFRETPGVCQNPDCPDTGRKVEVGPFYIKADSTEKRNYCYKCARALAETNPDLEAL